MMKFTSTLIFVLTGAVAAVPVGEMGPANQGTQEAIAGSINQWLEDILAVNHFLNNVLSSTNPSEDAVPILKIEQNEPTQLGILTGYLSQHDSNGIQASKNLQTAFLAASSSLQAIINAQNDPNIVAAEVAALNTNICNNVLGNIGILWESVAADNGLSGIDLPPSPNNCNGKTDFPEVE